MTQYKLKLIRQNSNQIISAAILRATLETSSNQIKASMPILTKQVQNRHHEDSLLLIHLGRKRTGGGGEGGGRGDGGGSEHGDTIKKGPHRLAPAVHSLARKAGKR